MVAFKHWLPLIQNEQGVAVPFESGWLKAAVDKAARKAGYESWWLLDEFSEAVSQYLRQDYRRSVIELPTLEKVVRATLRDIGYREIATRFRTVNPFQRLSLTECIGPAGEHRGAAFFKRLSERIDALHAAKVQHFHFYDLHVCAWQLVEDEFTSWSGMPAMRTRIVTFVRERVQTLTWQSGMKCSIC